MGCVTQEYARYCRYKVKLVPSLSLDINFARSIVFVFTQRIYVHVVYRDNKEGKWEHNQEEKFYDTWINRANECSHTDTEE